MFDADTCYPQLIEPTSFHLTPRDVIVQSWTRLPGPGRCRSLVGKDLLRAAFVNRSAASILKRCTGVNAATAIVDAIREEDGVMVGSDEFWSFLMSAQRRGLLSFGAQPAIATPVRITGATDALWPAHVSVELTKKCNLACIHCYANAAPSPRGEMETGELLKILQELSDRGLTGVELTGGEPLLHPDFWDIMEACLDNFFTISILTNGTLVTEAVVRRLAEYSSRLSFAISLDGSTAERHDAIRGPGSFDRTVRAIQRLDAAKVKVRVGMTVGAYNSDDVKATGEFVAALGITRFVAAPVLPFGRGQAVAEANDLKASEIQEAYDALPKLACQIEVTNLELFSRMGNCGIGTTTAMLSPTGQLKGCPFLDGDDCLGNIRHGHLDSVFGSDRVRALSALRAPEAATCSGCVYAEYCQGCIARGVQMVNTFGRLCTWAQGDEFGRAFPKYRSWPLLPTGTVAPASIGHA